MPTRILFAASPELLPDATRILLETRGYQLLLSHRYADAVGMILDDPPDILIVEKDYHGPKDSDLIRATQACLQKTNIPILLILHEKERPGLDWNEYQVDDILTAPFSAELLFARITLAEARMLRVFDNNPLTRLPGNTSIIRAINKTIDSGEGFAVCYADIDNFKPYNDRYGFTQGDDVILMVARILVNVIEEMAPTDSFVGHVGGDDFVFIVPEPLAESVCRKILINFETVKNLFLNTMDIAAGGYDEKDRQGRETRYALLSLSIAVVTTNDKRYSHFGEISATASQLKHCVKQKEGSNFLIDRRDPKPPTSTASPSPQSQ